MPNVSATISDGLLEQGAEYPGKKSRKRKACSDDDDGEKTTELQSKIDFESLDRPVATPEYTQLCSEILRSRFPDCAAHVISRCLRLSQNHYVPTFKKLKASNNKDVGTVSNRALNRIRFFAKAKPEGKALLKEMEWYDDHVLKKQLEKDEKLATAMKEEEHIRTGGVFECGCCFVESSFSRMTHCSETLHFFCLECAKLNAENQIGQHKYSLECMSMEGCTGTFDKKQIERFLPQKSLQLLYEIEQGESLRLVCLYY